VHPAHRRTACPGVAAEIKLGLLPAYGGTQFLPTLVGPSRALDLMLTGRAVDCREAMGMGLLSRVISEGESLLEPGARAGERGHRLQPGRDRCDPRER
jgi:enoyl-CoA hydratase